MQGVNVIDIGSVVIVQTTKFERPIWPISTECMMLFKTNLRSRLTIIAKRLAPIFALYLALIYALPVSGSADASPLPEASIMSSLGLNVHGRITEKELIDIESAGFKIIRLDLFWASVEKIRGQYDFDYYIYMAEMLKRHHFRPLFILDYSNSIYEPYVTVRGAKNLDRVVQAPSNDISREAFSNFASAAAQKLSKFDPIFEIWNEPDTGPLWPPAENVDSYSLLAGTACQAIHRSSPNTPVIGPGVAKSIKSGDPSPEFLTKFLSTDAAKCLDAISVHPYLWVSKLGETAEDWGELRSLIKNKTGKRFTDIRIVNSETGASTGSGHVSEKDQGVYAVRMHLENIVSGASISVWYDWKDDEPYDLLGGFGLLRRDGSPKPAYFDIKQMSSTLKNSRVVCEAKTSPGLKAVIFGLEDGRRWIVVWSNSPRLYATPGIVMTKPNSNITADGRYGWRLGEIGFTGGLVAPPKPYMANISSEAASDICR